MFYPAEAFPRPTESCFYANPLTFLITQAQDLLIWGKAPSWIGIGLYCAGSYLIAWVGSSGFRRHGRYLPMSSEWAIRVRHLQDLSSYTIARATEESSGYYLWCRSVSDENRHSITGRSMQ